MQRTSLVRRFAVALAVVATASVSTPWSAEAAIDTDLVRLTDSLVDFGDGSYVISAPIGSGSVQWNIVSGFYTRG